MRPPQYPHLATSTQTRCQPIPACSKLLDNFLHFVETIRWNDTAVDQFLVKDVFFKYQTTNPKLASAKVIIK